MAVQGTWRLLAGNNMNAEIVFTSSHRIKTPGRKKQRET